MTEDSLADIILKSSRLWGENEDACIKRVSKSEFKRNYKNGKYAK